MIITFMHFSFFWTSRLTQKVMVYIMAISHVLFCVLNCVLPLLFPLGSQHISLTHYSTWTRPVLLRYLCHGQSLKCQGKLKGIWVPFTYNTILLMEAEVLGLKGRLHGPKVLRHLSVNGPVYVQAHGWIIPADAHAAVRHWQLKMIPDIWKLLACMQLMYCSENSGTGFS